MTTKAQWGVTKTKYLLLEGTSLVWSERKPRIGIITQLREGAICGFVCFLGLLETWMAVLYTLVFTAMFIILICG
jgi:hypothetical protein